MQRQTRQHEAVLTALTESGRTLTPFEICEIAGQAVPRINLSTVYRQIKVLLEEAKVQRVELPGQPTRYEASHCLADCGDGMHHHHYFHCSGCDRVFPIHGCPGAMDELAPAGFKVERHELTLHGRCADCVAARA